MPLPLHEHREHKLDLAGAECKSSRMNMGFLNQPSVQSISRQAGHGVTQQLHFLTASGALWPHQLWSHLEWVGHCTADFTSPRALSWGLLPQLLRWQPALLINATATAQNSPEAGSFLQLLGAFLKQIRKSCHLLSWFFWPKALFSLFTQLSYSPGWVPSSQAIVNNQIHPQREEV